MYKLDGSISGTRLCNTKQNESKHAYGPCLSWSVELLNVFETFLPQLLMYPNPADPLNGEAAALLMNAPEEYRAKVRHYVARHATEKGIEDAESAAHGADSELSSVEDLESDDEANGMEL